MIEFKIISCPDRSQQATYQHLGNMLTIGQAEGDMIIDDPALAPLQLRISWQGGHYVAENLDEDVELRLNGKPLDGPTPIKERDNLNMGRTTINFSLLNTNPLQPPSPYEHPQFTARVTPGSTEKAILDALELQARQAPGPSGNSGMPPVPLNMPKPPPPPTPPPPPKKGWFS